MEIREPKFKAGEKVYCEESKCNAIITGISDYSFANDEYYYNLRYDDGDNEEMIESMLRPYQEPHKTVWGLQKGDECYFIDSDGDVLFATWTGISIDIKCRQTGNVFLNKEEAEFEVERRKIETEMLRLGGRRTFKKGEDNYVIYYAYDDDGLNIVSYKFHFYQGEIYFDSFKKVEYAIKTIGEDRIKKYIFGVES